MNSTTAPAMHLPTQAPAAARAVLRLLRRLSHGTLTVHWPGGGSGRFGTGRPPYATLQLHDWNACARALRSGDIGFAQSHVAGEWSTPDLPGLLELLLRNREQLEDVVYGHWAGRLAYRLRHLFRRNSRAGSRRNIQAHYDLGNAFYELWLDGTMNYSSAWFEGDLGQPMEQAQRAKVRRALRMAGVRPGSRVLEIGCGWGALAEAAAGEFGAHVTGLTLSTEQLAFARRRLERASLADRADLRLQDYRELEGGAYDAVCSIEMVEAVGREYWPGYFAAVARALRPGGKACIQSIVIDDRLWPRYVRSTDFIQQYIFPGGCLPCPTEFRKAARAAGLQVEDELAFGRDYAETLRRWRAAFLARRADVERLGFDAAFVRLWDFYLAYCEAAFEQGSIDVVQYTLRKA